MNRRRFFGNVLKGAAAVAALPAAKAIADSLPDAPVALTDGAELVTPLPVEVRSLPTSGIRTIQRVPIDYRGMFSASTVVFGTSWALSTSMPDYWRRDLVSS